MLTISVETSESIVAVIVDGRLDTLNSSTLDQSLQPLLEHENFLVVDLSKCNYLSSTGIRSLLKATKKVLSKQGALFLSGVTPEVYQVLEMAGLHRVFRFVGNLENAYQEALLLKTSVSSNDDIKLDDQHFLLKKLELKGSLALRWKNLSLVGYDELGFAVGIGSPAESMVNVDEAKGLFIAMGNCAGFIPENSALSPDFRIPYQPSDGTLWIDNALSFEKKPAFAIQLKMPLTSNMDHLIKNVLKIAENLIETDLGTIAMVVADLNALKPNVSFFSVAGKKDFMPLNQRGADAITINGFQVLGARFVLEKLEEASTLTHLGDFLKKTLTFENIESIEGLDYSDKVTRAIAWVFVPNSIQDSETKRAKVEVDGDFKLKYSDEFLIRRLYTDSSRVILKQLQGGFSAETFQVDSFDHEGRKLRPTVLKIANRDMITRESEHCKQYALPYILNNSAMVLGTSFLGDIGALRYNFVGIGGEQSQLKWLTHYFEVWPIDKLEPLFDQIFLDILNPWYGQPVRTTIYPFRDHDPTLTFFPNLFDAAGELFGISSDDPSIQVEGIDEKLLNPYWFLKHKYPQFREIGIQFYTAICHGDLNMQNILLDEKMNVYLIDFSETAPRSIVSDFARMEAIFMLEFVKDEDVASVASFMKQFYAVDQFVGQFDYLNWDLLPKYLHRNVYLTFKMRNYAVQSAKAYDPKIPYYLALLEWVLPVVCYRSASVGQKRLSMLVAGLICGKLMETSSAVSDKI